MMLQWLKFIPKKNLFILIILWLFGVIVDRIWFSLNQEIPLGQGYDLNVFLDYWQLLHSPDFWAGNWGHKLLLLSSHCPPFFYLSTLPLAYIFGTDFSSLTLILSVYSAILLLSVYGLGCVFFNQNIAIKSTFLCQVIPFLYYYRLIYNPLYPTTAIVTLSLFLLIVFDLKVRPTFPQNRSIYEQFKETISYPKIFKDYYYNLIGEEQRLDKIWLQKYSFYALNYFYSPQIPQEKRELTIIIKGLFKTISNFIILVVKDHNFKYALSFGGVLAIALLTSQISIIFLFMPICVVAGRLFFFLQGKSLCQFIISIFGGLLIAVPWYKTHWLSLLFLPKPIFLNSPIEDSLINFNIGNNWLYYLSKLPFLLSWLIFLITVITVILSCRNSQKLLARQFWQNLIKSSSSQWLIIILISSYIFLSLQSSQSLNNLLPIIPFLSIFIVVIIEQYQGKFYSYLQGVLVSFTILIMLGNIFPLPTAFFTTKLSPYFQLYPIFEVSWSPQDLIKVIIDRSPLLKNNVGFLVNKEQINPENFSFYGRQDHQQNLGYDLQLEDNINVIKQPFDWFLVEDNPQNSPVVKQLENPTIFQLEKQWQLKDNHYLKLYHRQSPLTQIKSLESNNSSVQLEQVIVSPQAPPGFPIPVTYKLSGKAQDLENGLLLLTWFNSTEKELSNLVFPSDRAWYHDQAIALGNLNFRQLSAQEKNQNYQIIQATAMLPSPGIALGKYQLKAIYWNKKTGENYQLKTESVNLEINLTADLIEAPELDLISQLRWHSINLGQGAKNLDNLIKTLIKMNQLEPLMSNIDHFKNLVKFRLNSLNIRENSRLITDSKTKNLLYNLALIHLLQKDFNDAVSTTKNLLKFEENNPYLYVYLAFIYLDHWQINQAKKALTPALEINPNLPEVKALNGLISLLQGHFFSAWQELNFLYEINLDSQSL